jgi:hypothetical protein
MLAYVCAIQYVQTELYEPPWVFAAFDAIAQYENMLIIRTMWHMLRSLGARDVYDARR